MTPDDSRRELASRWLAIASTDLKVARLSQSEAPSASLFHSQQAAEKAMKAVLAFHGRGVPKIHDLKELGNACIGLAPVLIREVEECTSLSDYAVVFRYLDAPYEPDAEEAADALARATALYDAIKAELKLPELPSAASACRSAMSGK